MPAGGEEGGLHSLAAAEVRPCALIIAVHDGARSGIPRLLRPQRGFSMVELLVTVVLAGIIFAAMVPVFANALKETSRDNFRVTATNIAQDRIEKIRMLNFADITADNLNSSSFADNEFGTSFTTVNGKTYTVENYFVADARSTRRSG